MFNKYSAIVLIASIFQLIFCLSSFAQISNISVNEAAAESVVTILASDGGQPRAVGSGLTVRSDGYVLTAYHLVKDAKQIQIRLRSGEIYDRAEIAATDARRNVALLHISAAQLRVIPAGAGAEENQVGARILVAANFNGEHRQYSSQLAAVQLAENIAGAGSGFRVMQFNYFGDAANLAGALVLDEAGRSLGIVTSNAATNNQNFAVPLSSVLGLINVVPVSNESTTSSVYTSSSLPSSPISAAAAKSEPVETKKVFSRNPKELLQNSKTVWVTSRTTFFKDQQLVNELLKRDIIKQWGWLFLDGNSWETEKKADLVIELDHQIFTYNFTFTLRHRDTSIVLAAGKVTILDGASGAPKMVDRIIEKLKLVLAEDKKTEFDKKNEKKIGN